MFINRGPLIHHDLLTRLGQLEGFGRPDTKFGLESPQLFFVESPHRGDSAKSNWGDFIHGFGMRHSSFLTA